MKARHIFKGCTQIEKEVRRSRKEKKEPELTAGEFFVACKWFGQNITESALKNEDADEAWNAIKDLPEAQGWNREAAGEVLFHCLKAAEDFERQERPKHETDDAQIDDEQE